MGTIFVDQHLRSLTFVTVGGEGGQRGFRHQPKKLCNINFRLSETMFSANGSTGSVDMFTRQVEPFGHIKKNINAS